MSSSKLTWTNNTSATKRSVTVRATISGVTKDLAIEQSAGSKVYSDITIVSFSYATFAAAGETKTPSLSYSQTWTWNGVSGSGGTITSGGTVTYGMTAATGFTLNNTSTGSITASNNKSENTRSTTASVTISNLNGKSKTTTATITQSAGSYWCSITAYGTPTISIGSGITAGGGSATVTASVSNTQTCYWNGIVESASAVNGTVTLSIQSQFYSTSSSATSGTAITRYSLSGTTLSHSTMGTTIAYDYCIVKATNANDSSKTATATNKVQNAVTAVNAVVNDTNVSSVHFTYSGGTSISKSGGSIDVTPNGACKFTFTSGSTDIKNTGGTYYGGTLSFARTYKKDTANADWLTLDTSSGKITAANNNTTSTREAQITGNLTATWGSLTHTLAQSRTVKQAAGSKQYGAWTVSISASVNPVAKTGGSSVITASASRTWGWNATSGGGTETGTIKLSKSGDATLSGTTSGSSLTYGNNASTSERSTTVTATCNEDTSKTASVVVKQAAGSIVNGNWTGGAISFSKTSLGAGVDSCTVTIQPWYYVWTWNGVSGSGGTTYYTGTVNVSENGSYTSLDATSYTASSSAKTLTLSKTTCGTDITTATTITVTADPATDGPGTTTGKISQNANVITDDGKTNPSYGSWVYNWTTTGNSTRTRTVTYTNTYSSGSTSNYSGGTQEETGGTRYIVLSSEDYANKVPVHTFPANGSGSTTLTTLSHDYWGGTFIAKNTITGVSCSCTGFTCSVSGSTLTITASSRGTAVGDYIKNTIVSSKSGFTTRSGYTFVAQEANARSLVSVYTVPYKPDNSWITDVTGSGSSTNWATVPASGGYLKSRAYANYTHTSGSPLNDQKITDDAAFSWSGNTNPTWITAHGNGGYYVNPNGQNTSTRTSTGTYSYTYGGVTKTCTEAITQAKDTYNDGTEYQVSAISPSTKSVGAAPGSFTLSYTIQQRTKRTWTVGGTSYPNNWTNSTATPTVSSSNTGVCTVGTPASTSVTISHTDNTSTSTRSATITVTKGTSKTCTVTQSAPISVVKQSDGWSPRPQAHWCVIDGNYLKTPC